MSWKINYREIFSGFDRVRLAILAFSILVTGVIWTGIYFQLMIDRDRTLKQQQAENENMVSLFERHVERTLATARFTLKQVEVEYAERGDLNLEKYYGRNRQELEPYSVLSIIDEYGIARYSSIPNFVRQNVREVENFKFHQRDPSEKIYVSKPRRGVASGNDTIYLSRRINKPDGSFGGYTVAGISPEYFSRFYDEINIGANSVVTLLGMDGFVRARRSNAASPGVKVGNDLGNTNLYTQHLKRSASGSYRNVSPVDNVTRQYSYKTVEGYPLVVLVGTSEVASLIDVEQRKHVYLTTATILSIVIGAFTLMILIRLRHEVQTVNALRLSERRYAHAQRATNDGLWDRNPKSGEIYLSSRARDILHHQHNAPFYEEDFFKKIHPDDVSLVQQFFAQSLESGHSYHLECRLRNLGDNYRHILLRGELVCDEAHLSKRMIGSITDITDQRIAEKRLQKQAELLDQIFRYTLDSLVILDKNYNFVRVSESYAKAGQRESSWFEGRNHFEIYPSEFQQEIEPFRVQKKIYSRRARPFIYPDHPEFGVTYWDITLVPMLDLVGEIEFFLMTLKDVTVETRAQKENQGYIRQLKELSRRVVAVQETERRALARELHDEIGQELTAVKLCLQTIEHTYQDKDDRVLVSGLEEVLSTISKILSQVRGISLNLRPMYLDDLGLKVAMVSLVERLSNVAGWKTHIDIDVHALLPEPDRDLACYRVAQEALTNIMRHAQASEVWVTLQYNNEWLELIVRDNGLGFDQETYRGRPMENFGLFGMEERVNNLGGQFEVNSSYRMGAELVARFPMTKTSEVH